MKWVVAPAEGDRHQQARQMLGQLMGREVRVEKDALGAPHLADGLTGYISISHCRTAVAVAWCEQAPIGIDVESRRRVSSALIERVCAPSEMVHIGESDDREMAFLQLWTRKEATLKCLGTGIRGFDGLRTALMHSDVVVHPLELDLPDTVASLAVKVGLPSYSPRR